MKDKHDGRVTSIRDLRQDMPPPRNLWPGIEAALVRESADRKRFRPTRLQLFSLAATVAALAIGIWIGRSLLPVGAGGVMNPSTLSTLPVGFVSDPRYLRQRASLLSGYQAQLDTLPPETREKVGASLATIHGAMKEIESALGRDPTNALLQEMLVNIYQDEMRVLTTVHEAASAQEI